MEEPIKPPPIVVTPATKNVATRLATRDVDNWSRASLLLGLFSAGWLLSSLCLFLFAAFSVPFSLAGLGASCFARRGNRFGGALLNIATLLVAIAVLVWNAISLRMALQG